MTDKGLTKKDEVLVELLMRTGLSKNMAKTLVYLRKKEETTSVEIESATGLRQPEVSIAMQDLRRRKWVTKRDIKKEGKGRPVHSNKLAIPFDKIVEILESEERKRIEGIEANIKQLKELAK
ncbi:MAG: ArsR family transcriptional regulator [Methanobacteriota archaeon]|nr:MAG: ArsR family transcriptional regulator [Euryarchaeota archaeon]